MRNDTQERIYIPQDLRMELMDWYHEILMHPGQARMEESVLQYFTWPGCTSDIKKFVQQCKICQKNKSTNVGQVGKIPLKDPPEMEPWENLTVDLCGPWKVMVEFWSQKKKQYGIWALTLMDEATGWVERQGIAGNSTCDGHRMVL